MNHLRRTAVRMLLHAGTIFLVAPAGMRQAAAADSCVDAASESLRTSLNYANPSPDASRTCGGCAFFTRDATVPACGQCTIMSSPVDAGGVCDSWAGRDG